MNSRMTLARFASASARITAMRAFALGDSLQRRDTHLVGHALAIHVLAHQVTHPDATWTINPLASHTRALGGRRRRLDPCGLV